jgi:predicted transcriptional regulator
LADGLTVSYDAKMVSVSDTLSAISDDISKVLFNTITLASGDSSILIRRLNLMRRQYYSRMSDLINDDLVIRMNGKYFVTSLGKVVYKAQELIGRTLRSSMQSTLLNRLNFHLQNQARLLIL